MNILKAREIVNKALDKHLNEKKGEAIDISNVFANILAEETTEAFLKGVKFGKGYKVEDEG